MSICFGDFILIGDKDVEKLMGTGDVVGVLQSVLMWCAGEGVGNMYDGTGSVHVLESLLGGM